MSFSVLDSGSIQTWKYIVTHVFCPLLLPDQDDHSFPNDCSLVGAIAKAAQIYDDHIDQANINEWRRISRMLKNLSSSTQSETLDEEQIISALSSMDVGDTVGFPIRAQNAGIIFRRQKDDTIVESFELSPEAKDVMAAQGKLICSYPGPAIEIPNDVFFDDNFLGELVNFLVHMNDDDLGTVAALTNQGGQMSGFKDTAHPRYIIELLTGILRSVGRPADIPRICKRIGDDVVGNDSKLPPWRRSSLWLLIRVTLQTTLHRSPLRNHTYKEFMLFFMCCLASEAKEFTELPNDLLHFMSTKISRRLRKLGTSAPDWLSRTVLEKCTFFRSTIEERWKQVQATQRVSPPWTPSRLDLVRDTQLSRLHCSDYIRNSVADHSTAPSNTSFSPKHTLRGTLDDFLSSNSSLFDEIYRVEPYTALYDVERAVEMGIDSWVDRVVNNDEACERLEILAQKYSSSASKTYADNPELLSITFLTTIELWVALDKVATKEIPILADYSPEVPRGVLENLLLCMPASLDRLRRAHEYLSRRHSQSRDGWSVFTSEITSNSFAVRFFRKSSHLQRLKARIEEVAQGKFREKTAELWKMNTRYFISRMPGFRRYVDYIFTYRWPLPANFLEAEMLVFELDCPVSFNMWRTTLFHLLDLCSPPVQRKDEFIPQFNDDGTFKDYLVQHPRSRVMLSSRSVQSHHTYLVKIPARLGQVIITLEFEFIAFDTCTGFSVFSILERSDNSRRCSYKLPSGPYLNLQKYVESTSHSSNDVIANQADCHDDLSVHEYMSFGHLRSGGSLQWLNVLRELRGRLLTFRLPEVYMLFAQAVSQAGPFANASWTWHQEIQNTTFCHAVLEELQNLMQDAEANWTEMVTLDTISFLLRRVLSASPDQTIVLKAVDLLRTVRSKAFLLIPELSARLAKMPENEGPREVLLNAAAICRGSFDVDPALILRVLGSAEDIEVLISSSIIICDHLPNDISCLTAYSRLLLDRDRRLSLRLESILSDIIQADPSDQGINLAIHRVWPDYHPGSKWTPWRGENSHWFSCTTAPPAEQCPQAVHLNILDGTLLVEGKPLGARLPNEILQHPLYRLTFGSKTFETKPSDLQGMDYCTEQSASGSQIYFSIRNNGSDLIIRIKRKGVDANNTEVIELIPHEQFDSNLPTVLIQGHAHWLNLSTNIIEIHPVVSDSDAPQESWKIDCTPGHYRIWKGHEFLIDMQSQTWDMVSKLLGPLSLPQDLIISVSPLHSSQSTSSLQLSVFLPRYDLSFYVDEDGDLQCRNFRDMVYDEDQSIGTLFGLVNQLVLRPKIKSINLVEPAPRCVLIPDGVASFRKDDHHVQVEISIFRMPLFRVSYKFYKVDTDLGCLAGDGSLTSKLYCAYLHALTNGCSADPLTGRSGTEEALSVLQSAGCLSIGLHSHDAELLSSIASICPSRKWYSENTVQKVEWRNLPVSSQNHELYVLAKAIKERYERVQQFHERSLLLESSSFFKKFPTYNDHLLMRNATRAGYLCPIEFLERPSNANVDAQYTARDQIKGEHLAFKAATYVYHRSLTKMADVWEMMTSWKNMTRDSEFASLQYDKSWLNPDLPSIWLKMYDLLRQKNERKWFQLLFSLPAMVYSSSNYIELIPVFIAFAKHSQFCPEDPPNYEFYPIAEGCYPSEATLHKYVVDCTYSFTENPKSFRATLWLPQVQMYKNRRQSATVQYLLKMWPCETLPPCTLDPELYDVTTLAQVVQKHFSDCNSNLKLREHVTRVQLILNNLQSGHDPVPDTPLYSFRPSRSLPLTASWQLFFDLLLTRSAPQLSAYGTSSLRLPTDARNSVLFDSTSVYQLIATVGTNAENPFQRRYVSALHASAKCFEKDMFLVAPQEMAMLNARETLVEHYTRCRFAYLEALHQLRQHLYPRSISEKAVELSGQWPRVTAQTLFRLLASTSPITLPDSWKRCLISVTQLALTVQRARRLLTLYFDGLYEEFYNELRNEGCDGWNAETHPDWLLIQLQGNFLIRRVQAEVANEMISPRSGCNMTIQLHMGEGKTSVIVPMVAVVLANGDQLVRIIVPKPLTVQTLHILADRLSGLTNRRIYCLPFSRNLQVNSEKVASLHQIMLECMRERGILVLQPEHVLSLKLVSVEKQLSLSEGHKLALEREFKEQLSQQEIHQTSCSILELEKWLRSHSRDILDESDEVFDARSQLVFTIGSQQNIEGSPERWTTTQQVLGLINMHSGALRELFPLGVEYEPGPPESFSHLRILQVDAGRQMVSWIVQDIIDGLLPNINLGHLQSGLRDAVRSFISCENVSFTQVQLVKEHCQKPLWDGLLLLRGLLADGIICSAFRERRWRVDYGLALMHTMLAVPYRAKDVPAQRAEFGHPDVAILLTCLSYYYGGLTVLQLRACFEILSEQQDPSLEYNFWIRCYSTLPKLLRSFSNTKDELLKHRNDFIYHLFSRNRATINFYLSRVVFPKETKQFPLKLTCSGWNLAEKKEHLLTGFSGTNDGQYLLPLYITQRDLDHQRGSNARVLSYLLRPENNHYMCMAHENGGRRTAHEFLRVLVAQKPEIRVLLDVGAQMLDLRNHELANAWLQMDENASGAVYFSEDDEIMVCTRDGIPQHLRSSPFVQQLDRCVVYLDDAHTRGSDFKFPDKFRAAVTLGPRVTKDRLAQGCMRMRKLGHGHSIMFFAPLEVDRIIRSLSGKEQDPSCGIETIDILHWAIRETWNNIQRWAPQWAQQGMDHASQYAAWSGFCDGQVTPKELADKWLQPEAKRLEDLYVPRDFSKSPFLTSPEIRQRCIDLGITSLFTMDLDEEHERELIYEVVLKEQAVAQPPRVSPAKHSIHLDIVNFVNTGIIRTQSISFGTSEEAFKPVFKTLDVTSAVSDESYVWSQSVLVTKDFEKTVHLSGKMKMDDYLRPVRWVVSTKRDSGDVLVILSPHEVDFLLPYIRSSDKVHLHLYTPTIVKSMKPCDDLSLYSIPTVPDEWAPPSHFMDELNVFAGQLYLKDRKAYTRLCRFLCVYAGEVQGEKGIRVESDGFIQPKNRHIEGSKIQIAHTFSSSPNTAIKALMDVRNRGIDCSLTHMGKLVRGKLLLKDDFDE